MNLSLSRAVVTLLGVAVFLSALALIDSRHQNRVLFEQLQQAREQRDQLNIDWGRLLLEQSTWSTHAYIEQSATQKLDMGIPANPQVLVVKP
ncbi:MAG TPA: cell division protein FtsL [Gammaproteobacteria bacterium]|jgi:cell division protein FtsL|nr:cell division protein FtsL [Gammaproteobacteria bacterium]